MASSRRSRSADLPSGTVALTAAERFLSGFLRDERRPRLSVAVGLSGGMDSVVLLHVLAALAPRHGFSLAALHVNHGLSPNALAWEKFCRTICRELGIGLQARRVQVGPTRGIGLEAAARDARRAAYGKAPADVIALAHHLDDQAETVLLNLMRGSGIKGASGMQGCTRLGTKVLIRPLLDVPREAILAYAAAHRLSWIEDESNLDEKLRRNFIRRQVGPLLATRFPRWREGLGRAARLFGSALADERALLREALASGGLRAPSERKLMEMLRQISGARHDSRVAIAHDGALLRMYRGTPVLDTRVPAGEFKPRVWNGERSLSFSALGGTLHFLRRHGEGIDASRLAEKVVTIRLRGGGERLQLDPRRRHRTLKNLFQEAGIAPWERTRLPLLFCGADLVWAAGLGVQAAYAANAGRRGILPEWRPIPAQGRVLKARRGS